MQRQDALQRQCTMTEYFGGDEPFRKDILPLPRSSLTFTDQNVDNVTSLVFKGMQGSQARPSNQLSKKDLRTWVKTIMEKKYPGKQFDESAFEKGFGRMDVNQDGKLDIADIRTIVMKKVKRENLYIGKAH